MDEMQSSPGSPALVSSTKPKVPERPAAPRRPRAAPIHCHECGQRVLLADRVAIGAISLHKQCLFCAKCGAEMAVADCRVVRGQFFCPKHYDRVDSDSDESITKVPVEKTSSAKAHKRLQRSGATGPTPTVSKEQAANMLSSEMTSPSANAAATSPGAALSPPATDGGNSDPTNKTDHHAEKQSNSSIRSSPGRSLDSNGKARTVKFSFDEPTEAGRLEKEGGKGSKPVAPTYRPPPVPSEANVPVTTTEVVKRDAEPSGRKSPVYGPRIEGCSMPSRQSRLLVGMKISVEGSPAEDSDSMANAEGKSPKRPATSATLPNANQAKVIPPTSGSSTLKPSMGDSSYLQQHLKQSTDQIGAAAGTTKPDTSKTSAGDATDLQTLLNKSTPPKPARSTKPPAPSRPNTAPVSKPTSAPPPKPSSGAQRAEKTAKRKAPKPPSCPAPPPPKSNSHVTDNARAPNQEPFRPPKPAAPAARTATEYAVVDACTGVVPSTARPQTGGGTGQPVIYATTKSYGKKRLPTPDAEAYRVASDATRSSAVPAATGAGDDNGTDSALSRPTQLPIQGVSSGNVQTKPNRRPPGAPSATGASGGKPANASKPPKPKKTEKPADPVEICEEEAKPQVDRSIKLGRGRTMETVVEVPYQETNVTCWPRRSRSHSGRRNRHKGTVPASRTPQEEMIYQRKRAPSLPKNVQRWMSAKVIRGDEVSLSEIEDKLQQLSNQHRALELEGQRLEEKLRNGNPNEERVMKEWLQLVEEKNTLVSKESELVYLQQDLQLSQKRDELEAEIHRRLSIDSSKKTKHQLREEDGLILQLVETVNTRNRLVNMLDLERLI